MSLWVHIGHKKKDISILGLGLIQGLDDATLTAHTQYSINFLRWNKRNYSNKF